MHRKVYFVVIEVCLAMFAGSPLVAQIVAPDAEVVHPYRRATVPDLAVVTASDASRPAVAKAALAIVLSGSKVKCDPDSHLNVAIEANAGSPLRTLVTKMSGASCASNGQSQHVTVAFTPNGAIQANNLIAPLLEGKPLLVGWRGNLYVLYGVVYDEHLHSDGRQDNVIRELLLIDPRYSDKRRLVAFDRERDDFAQIEGVAGVSVSQ